MLTRENLLSLVPTLELYSIVQYTLSDLVVLLALTFYTLYPLYSPPFTTCLARIMLCMQNANASGILNLGVILGRSATFSLINGRK